MKKLTKKQIESLVNAGAFTTYKGEVILIDEVKNEFYFNAQDFFTSTQLKKMPYSTLNFK